jgi:secondary thiamine-phosphate synthase enzyme
MRKSITMSTNRREGLYDITPDVKSILSNSGISDGILTIYVQGATAGIMIQENWDQSVQNDVINLFRKLVPKGIWEHDEQDGNGDSHLKAGIVGPSETIPVINGSIGLSTWQNIFLCEFDGPRQKREIIISIIEDK